MFRHNLGKSLFIASVVLLGAAGCNFWANPETPASAPTPFAAPELPNEIPFSTREPDVFQAEIVITNFVGGEKDERKILVARDGARRRTTFNIGEKNEISFIKTDAGGTVLVFPGKKIFVEMSSSAAGSKTAEAFEDFLTTGWLNRKTPASFENLGAENGLAKYRVRPDGAQNSEILIFVDESLKLPVRQEFYSVKGEEKTLTFSVELKNLKPEAGDRFFQTPKDYKKVPAGEFQRRLGQEKSEQ